MHFLPGDADGLANAIMEFAKLPESEKVQMRQNARHEFESKYTAEQNYRQLLDIYNRCINLQNPITANSAVLNQ